MNALLILILRDEIGHINILFSFVCALQSLIFKGNIIIIIK